MCVSTRFLRVFLLVPRAFCDAPNDAPLLLYALLAFSESLRCFPAMNHNRVNRIKLVLKLIASQIPMSRPVHFSSSKQRGYLDHRHQNDFLP